jgi:hypothetical protein
MTAKSLADEFEKVAAGLTEPSKLAEAMKRGILQEDDAVETVLSCLEFLRRCELFSFCGCVFQSFDVELFMHRETSTETKCRLLKSCEVYLLINSLWNLRKKALSFAL